MKAVNHKTVSGKFTFHGHWINEGTSQLWFISVCLRITLGLPVTKRETLVRPKHLFHRRGAGNTECPWVRKKARKCLNLPFHPCLKCEGVFFHRHKDEESRGRKHNACLFPPSVQKGSERMTCRWPYLPPEGCKDFGKRALLFFFPNCKKEWEEKANSGC